MKKTSNIQYGLLVITTGNGGRDNGCISNTVAQETIRYQSKTKKPSLID